jgi:hypothetical protein
MKELYVSADDGRKEKSREIDKNPPLYLSSVKELGL